MDIIKDKLLSLKLALGRAERAHDKFSNGIMGGRSVRKQQLLLAALLFNEIFQLVEESPPHPPMRWKPTTITPPVSSSADELYRTIRLIAYRGWMCGYEEFLNKTDLPDNDESIRKWEYFRLLSSTINRIGQENLTKLLAIDK